MSNTLLKMHHWKLSLPLWDKQLIADVSYRFPIEGKSKKPIEVTRINLFRPKHREPAAPVSLPCWVMNDLRSYIEANYTDDLIKNAS